MQGLLSDDIGSLLEDDDGKTTAQVVAEAAYCYADAMLAESEISA